MTRDALVSRQASATVATVKSVEQHERCEVDIDGLTELLAPLSLNGAASLLGIGGDADLEGTDAVEHDVHKPVRERARRLMRSFGGHVAIVRRAHVPYAGTGSAYVLRYRRVHQHQIGCNGAPTFCATWSCRSAATGQCCYEHGRTDVPFEIHATTIDSFTAEGIKRLEVQGVTHTMGGFSSANPYSREPDAEPLQAKLDALRTYADNVIARSR